MPANAKVYVIDDDPAMRDSLDFLLGSAGFRVRLFDSAQAFLSEVATLEAGCVVTDVRMVDWIAMAKTRVPHAIVTVTTNGSLVTPKITDRLIHSGLDAIWFSFNGATKETYEQIMGLSFDQVKKNIDYLLENITLRHWQLKP